MGDVDEYFPRGGKKPTVTQFKQSGNFLGAIEKGEKKRKKIKKKQEADDGYLSDEAVKEVDQSYKNCASGISYKTIKPGVLILGRVKQAMETKVHVMLPSKMRGSVMACHISEPYTRILEEYVNDKVESVKDLPAMFRPGQYVALKVLEVNEDKLMLSMMPQHLHANIAHTDLKKGVVLQAAVSSVEDHGYVMDLGIANTRAFLPKANSNPDIDLDVGALTWCTIKSVDSTRDSSIVSLSNELPSLQQAVVKRPGVALLPGCALEFTVDKPLENGIEGRVLGDTTAYVQRQHADNVKGKKPMLGQKVRVRLLYVMPTRNAPYATMRDIFSTTHPDLTEEQNFQDGDIVEEAQVIKITGRSIYFKLGQGAVASMSLRRVQVDENLSDQDVIAKSYPIGSKHRVRVYCYNLSDYMYTVTDRRDVLDEKYFSVSQLSVGDIVPGVVSGVEGHVLLNIGRLKGVVPQMHISDAGVYVDPKKASTSKLPKKKYKVGQEVKARVLELDASKNRLVLTMKPSLLAADLEVLQSYDQAQVGKAYTGVIKAVRDYVLVSFFNNVVGLVPRSYVTKEPVDSLAELFHPGQIVTCTVLKVDPQASKMTCSLTTTPFWPEKKRELPEKRKQNQDKKEEIPNKKKKVTEETETQDDKKKSKNKKRHLSETETENDETNKISEESDAIETDIQENDQVLTADDLHLIDLSDCNNGDKCKKRVSSLLKSIKARTTRIKKIEKKIAHIEEKGLNAKNKKFHTAMHLEKLMVEERIQKLTEALDIAKEKLKEFDEERKKNNEGKEKKEKSKEKKKDKKKEKKKKDKNEEIEKESSSEDESENKIEEVEVKKDKKAKIIKDIQVVNSLEPAIEIPSAKDFWSTSVENTVTNVQEDESSSSEEEEEAPKKKRKKLSAAEKVAKARAEEERVREMERRAIESEHQPRSSDQFERALLAAPARSDLWIAYMAFHLQATEIEKARAVGRKALKTIPFREEQEKLNVWLAMINCENRFGTKESQQKILEEALQMNEPFSIHSKLLDIYVDTGKQQELSTLVDLMMRKYKRDPNTYIMCGSACFKMGLVNKARQVMQKAVAVLEKKEHVSILVQFALLERSHGESERAEALFEQVLAVYPNRVDVVNVYVDMLVKSSDIERVRQVMERMTSQKLPARKMKVLFKKWIEVEEKIGSKDQVESIRERALEYIDKAKF